MNIATNCQFCLVETECTQRIPWLGRGDPDVNPGMDYTVVTGCLAELHIQAYVCCGRHLVILRDHIKQIPCPECEVAAGSPVSYLAECLYRVIETVVEGEEWAVSAFPADA